VRHTKLRRCVNFTQISCVGKERIVISHRKEKAEPTSTESPRVMNILRTSPLGVSAIVS
jgi:hypothetical protein